MHNYGGTCKSICCYNVVQNFLIQLFPLKSLVFVLHFVNAFGLGNEAFLKGTSWNEMVLLLVFFHLPYIKYKTVNICFYSRIYQNQNFLLESHFCCLCRTRVVLVFLVSHLCCTSVILVSLFSHSCCWCLALVL